MNHMINRPPGRPGPGRQRGAVLLFAALGISALIVMASLIDLGLLYQYRREYQKTADLAALAGAAKLTELGCAAAAEAARQNVEQNLVDFRHDAPVIQTGEWRRNESPAFVEGCDASTNAIRVIVSGRPPALLAPAVASENQRRLSAQSVASNSDPVASFSVGSRLAAVGGASVVGGVLKAVGLDLAGVDLLGYDGLAGVTITPSGLLQALGIPVSANLSVTDFNAVLAAEEVSLGALLDAAVTVAGQSELVGVNTQLLEALRVPLSVPTLNDIVVQLGSDAAGGGVFAAVTSSADAALNVELDALGLVSTAIQVATAGRGIEVALATPTLGPLLGADLDVRVGIIEPPSIAIGGVGATAYSAQTRVFAHVQLDTGDIPLAGNLLGLLGTSITVDLPIIIDLAAAKGTVADLCTPSLKSLSEPPQCPAGEDCAEIDVEAQIAKICVGKLDDAALFSTSESCDVGLTGQKLLGLTVLGTNLASLNTSLALPAVETEGTVVLAAEQMDTVNGALDLGTTVKNLTDALLAGLLATSLNDNPPLTAAQRTDIANKIWQRAGGNVCASNLSGKQCRRDSIQRSLEEIQNTTSGLGGFLADALLNPIVGLLSSVLTLNLVGVLQSVGSLLGGVLGLVGGLLSGLLNGLFGDSCTGGGILGLNPGSNSACVDDIKNALNSVPSGGTTPTALFVLLGSLLNLLQPILDAVGTNLLLPLLQNVLGLQLGQTDISMLGLECRAGSVLVE
ncbi:MAG: pilus assembly protein TadG-related protein [Pseudomonadota bacterium]|nr:pilus assembly protein TadG-related protein [Pseudomonadota bacterium]